MFLEYLEITAKINEGTEEKEQDFMVFHIQLTPIPLRRMQDQNHEFQNYFMFNNFQKLGQDPDSK